MMDGRKEIIGIIKELKNVSEIDESIDLIESGFLDSFDIINLISKIEERFKIKIMGEDIIPENLNSIDSIVNLINKTKI
ncbi:MAG: acyl carrier protein [Nanoarchaeota archaeon]|nr:acyl carrier protein [Nanoarchaeota archaeon]